MKLGLRLVDGKKTVVGIISNHTQPRSYELSVRHQKYVILDQKLD